MIPAEHEEAQKLVDAADRYLAAGEVERAEEYYIGAAELEAKALALIPRDKRRTIGILGVSLASLWYRASRYSDAERVARELLAGEDLLPPQRRQLEDILDAIPQTVALASGGAILTAAPPERPTSSRPPLRAVEELTSIHRRATKEKELEALYLQHRTLLLYVTCRKFRIPDVDAEALIQEVFAAFAEMKTQIANPRAWLVAAACNASRHYWRTQGRTESLPEDFNDRVDPASSGLADRLIMTLTIRRALEYLEPRHRNALVMHYFEGRTVAEIAHMLETTPRYAERIIDGALHRVRAVYASISRPPGAT